MKKFIALLLAVVFIFSMMSFTTNAEVPTSLTIKETKSAPNLNDGGAIDSVYGEKVFDVKATDHAKDSGNLYPSNYAGRDGHKLEESGVQAAIAVMRNVGYMTYDKENLYLACDVTDIAPKAASNSGKPWESTNLQIAMYVNEELSFPGISYEGTNKVKVWNDSRSVLNLDLVECTFTEKSKTNYVYEIKIPWKAFPDIDSPDDVWYFRMGIVQSSMANGYVCSAFGEAYFLEASKAIPVKLVSADKKENTSSKDNSNTTSKDNNQTTSKDNNQTTSKEDNEDISVDAPTTGTEIVTDNSNVSDTVSVGDEGTTTVVTEDAPRNWTPIIIIAVVAFLIIAGGAVAIIMLNKKPSGEDKADK